MINPSRYRILTIGKIKKPWIQEGIESYLKRIPDLTITEIRDSNQRKESEKILSSIKKDETLIVLGEQYQTFTSISFAEKLREFENQRLVFLIGGSDGISPEIKKLSPLKMSLSPLTFPHEIARLLLVEQLYRAHTILQEAPYHRQ